MTITPTMTTKKESRRKQLEVLRAALEKEQTRFRVHWRELVDHVRPRRAQWSTSETNQKELRNLYIVNNTATLASRTMASGMMGGITSPARPWFRLGLPDSELAEQESVKAWLHLVAQRMTNVFLRSNLYNALPILYGDLGDVATGAMLIEEDFGKVVRFYTLPIGTYYLALNDKLEVDVFHREFSLTVRQLVERFGEHDENGNPKMSKFSQSVQANYQKDQLDEWVDVYHTIQRNKDYNPKSLTSKLYQSMYYEKGTTGSDVFDQGKFLRDKGYDYFPVLCPRWGTTGEDVYGTNSPGMVALGDIKALQVLEKRKAQAVDKMVNPPLKGPVVLKNSKVSLLPGDISYIDTRSGMEGLTPIHEVRFDIAAVSAEIDKHEFRIRRAYFEDLFLMLANTDRRQITATEIVERQEEKLLALGPVLEQLNQDLLDPLIDITFDIMVKQGYIPPPPEELQGMQLKVEYISIMHQAQKLAGLSGIERLAQFIGELSEYKPEVADKLNADQMVDDYADIVGSNPGLIYSDEVVAEMREARAEAEAAMAQAEQLKNMGGAAKDLAGADMEGNNALTQLMAASQAGALQ